MRVNIVLAGRIEGARPAAATRAVPRPGDVRIAISTDSCSVASVARAHDQSDHVLTLLQMQRELLTEAAALWGRPVFELRLAAIEALAAAEQLLEAQDLGSLEGMLRESRTWALVDALATGTLARLVERFPRLAAELDRLAEDQDFWIRRSAMLALLPAIRRGGGDFERFAGYADQMLEEREFFIRKAIGWVLREASKKRPDLVYQWLLPRVGRASGVTLREAVKYLSPEQRGALGRP